MLNNLKQNFYIGGYYIIKPLPRPNRMNDNVLHELILSASRCICKFYPDYSVIWNESKTQKEEYMKAIGIDGCTYDSMECWLKEEECANNFDFPDVFNNYESAIEFCRKFLYNQSDLRVIGVALPAIYRDSFIKEQNDLRNGICNNLMKYLSIDSHSTILGYEILGFEQGGFHSYICNGLQNEYYKKYKLTLNENGFISSLEEAQTLADYTNEQIEAKEPVLWLPWAILDTPYNNN